MANITKLEAAGRQLDSAIRMFFANEDILAVQTNFLKHADRDPDGEIDDNFYVFTEAGIGMAIGLYVHNKQAVTNEMKGYRIWSAMMRPKYFDIPDDLKKLADDWRANSQTDPDKITELPAISGPHSCTGSNCVTPPKALNGS